MLNQLQEQLVNCGIHFIRALSDVYGADRAMEVWDEMSSFLPDNLKAEIFLAMLLGMNHTVEIHSFGANPVFAMKVLAKYTKMDHTEIYSLVQQHRENGKVIIVELADGTDRLSFIEEFNQFGCKAV